MISRIKNVSVAELTTSYCFPLVIVGVGIETINDSIVSQFPKERFSSRRWRAARPLRLTCIFSLQNKYSHHVKRCSNVKTEALNFFWKMLAGNLWICLKGIFSEIPNEVNRTRTGAVSETGTNHLLQSRSIL